MAKPDKRPRASPPRDTDRERQEKEYDLEVEGSFPASDPPSSSQPSGGITGPTSSRKRRALH